MKVVRIKMRRPCSWEGDKHMCPPYLGVSEEQLQGRARKGSPGKDLGRPQCISNDRCEVVTF